MALTKLYQVVELGMFNNVWKVYRTEQECHDYLAQDIPIWSPVTLTVIPIWTNASAKEIEGMLK